MHQVRAVEGLGWVDAASGRFVLPDASRAAARGGPAAPSGALPLELVETEAGRVAIVRGSVLDGRSRAEIRACLAPAVVSVTFLVASEGATYLVDPESDLVTSVRGLAALRAARELDEVEGVLASTGAGAAYVPTSRGVAEQISRDVTPIREAYERATSAAVVRADVDRLMVYNDWLGFSEGDLLLARLLEMACRVRGEQAVRVSLHRRDVLLVAPDATAEEAAALAESLVEAMRRARVQLRHPEVRHVPYMTLSAGAAWVHDVRAVSLDRALAAADAAVQRAKLAGRDRVEHVMLSS